VLLLNTKFLLWQLVAGISPHVRLSWNNGGIRIPFSGFRIFISWIPYSNPMDCLTSSTKVNGIFFGRHFIFLKTILLRPSKCKLICKLLIKAQILTKFIEARTPDYQSQIKHLADFEGHLGADRLAFSFDQGFNKYTTTDNTPHIMQVITPKLFYYGCLFLGVIF
jgi:hypothetical protein